MKPTLTLTALALVLASVPAVASPDRAAGPRAMLQNLTFAEVDADADGAVTLAEWRAFVTARAESARGARIEQRVSDLFEGDADGDGLLSPEELSARIAALQDARRADRAERRASRAEDRPRRWGGHEGHGRHQGRHEGRQEGRMGGRMGAGMDGDQWIVRSFQRIDADGDARITEAEFDAARARMAERMERRGRQGG
jgi:Ca2+-binding EF-hand superfamily protein